jgi:hypothetical protein
MAIVLLAILVLLLVYAPGYAVLNNLLTPPKYSLAPAKPTGPLNHIDETDSVVFFENFESGAIGWTFSDLIQPLSWHVDDYNHYSGGGSTLSWWSGDTTIMGYNDHTLVYLESPTLNLTGAINPTLTFELFYSFESPAGATPPYDGWDACNVWVSTNNGDSWSVLTNPTPAYNITNAFSFGHEFGLLNTPGWGGYSGGASPGAWVEASFSLNDYLGSQVKIRFAMCSDQAHCTLQNPTLRGMFVDNIQIDAGANTYLENNAEGLAIPSEMLPAIPLPVGSFWHVEDLTAPPFPAPIPSPTHVARMSDGTGISAQYPPLTYCALISPMIDLRGYTPGSGNLWADFRLTGQINVDDPDSFPNLDVWTIEVKPDTAPSWYNYYDPFNQGSPHLVMSSLPYNTWDSLGIYPNLPNGLSLNPYLGYRIQVRVVFQADLDSHAGYGMLMDNFQVTFTPPQAVKAGQGSTLPSTYNLYQNSPNPFNPSTVIRYDLPVSSRVNMAVYALDGRLVSHLVNTFQEAGRHETTFEATNLASGVYVYKLKAGMFSGSGKMVLLK